MINRVKHIIIFGGGTSGWLTAAYLTNKLNFPCKITIIENKVMGTIGVGEGTQPYTARFLSDAGLKPKDWMKPSNASFKYGVLLDGWNDTPYFIDNDYIDNTIMAEDLYTHDYFISKDKKQFFDWMPAARLAMANKSPKIGEMDHMLSQENTHDWGAVHFSAADIVDTLHELIKDRIEYFDTNIVTIDRDNNGITKLIDENGKSYEADLYLDCSGFKSKLLEETLGIQFTDISNILPCDKAVAIPTEYKDPINECHPYTKATAMNAGWRWTIPTFKRIGNGYVYSSKYLTKEQAEAELRESIGEYTAKAKHLDMRCGSHKQIAYKNVVAVGLAAGFVEPLEATGITFTTKIVEALTVILNSYGGVWSSPSKLNLNTAYGNMMTEIITFVWAHYHFSMKDDTPFWKAIRSQKIEDAPEYVQQILSHFNNVIHRNFFLDPKTSGFHSGHWFSVLHAGNHYKQIGQKLTGDRLKYAEYFVNIKKHEIDMAIDVFPNHYEYLKEWYGL